MVTLLVPLASAQNLLDNPSFERANKRTAYYSGTHSKFNRNIGKWTSPNQGSPDILPLNMLPEIMPKRKGVDLPLYAPRTGEIMLGIKTYGCESGTMHCKEYIQTRVLEPIRRDSCYYYRYYVQPTRHSKLVNGFGIGLSDTLMKNFLIEGIVGIEPSHFHDAIVDSIGGWTKIEGVFRADGNYNYVLFGNFFADADTKVINKLDQIPYSYYLLDDVYLSKAPSCEVPKVKVLTSLVLKDVLFATNQATIQNGADSVLIAFAKALKQYNNYKISVIGHTDNRGTAEYNLQLSKRRAQAVAAILMDSGIEANVLHPSGKGETESVATNDTAAGRALNRRVEIIVEEREGM